MIIRSLKFISGIILVLIGLIGLVMPILPGWLFLIPGLILIKPSHKEKILFHVEKWKTKIGKKPPHP
ncbi:MAG: hypothetical protein NTZ25_02635 [Candidatus Peregrinibacteria bacterium]|nr:hypothetical protein [Candidatus Peregrinibacteria bacterium]